MLPSTRNEHTSKLKIVFVQEKGTSIPSQLASPIKVLDREYPEVDIGFAPMEGSFGPKLIRKLSKE
ncbi:MAG: hypothetical protein DHS20C18_50320 [Saprospiraceae bacterium]|nr:MAG: hypothetical protein DHS20C18_50320 [Saprospiraceae bacterium]